MLQAEGNDQQVIASKVYSWYRRHGIEPRWQPGARQGLEAIGRNDTDAERSLVWLHEQVGPVVRRLQEWYDRRSLIALLFDGAEPSTIRPDTVRGEDELGEYDQWTILKATESVTESAILT